MKAKHNKWSGVIHQFDCCVCLEKKRNRNGATNIFEPWTPLYINCPTTIATEMSKLADVDLSIMKINDDPALICKSCFIKLDTALQFINTIQQSAKYLKQKVDFLPGSELTKEENDTTENSDLEVKQELEEEVNKAIQTDAEELDSGEMGIKDEEDDHMSHETSPAFKMDDHDFADSDDELDPLNTPRQYMKEYNNSTKKDNDRDITKTLDDNLTNINIVSKLRTSRAPICSCENDCLTKISKSQLNNITTHFQSLGSIAEQNKFVKKWTIIVHKQRQRNDKTAIIVDYEYFLPKSLKKPDSDKVPVCLELFKSVVPFNGNVNDICKEQDNPTTETLMTQHIVPTTKDTAISICDHFKDLQKRRLEIMSLKKSGVLKQPVEKLTFGKMFKLYTEWFKTTNYNRKPRTLREYKNVLMQNVDMDHILTLQRSGRRRPPQRMLISVKESRKESSKGTKVKPVLKQTPIKREQPAEIEIKTSDDDFEGPESVHSGEEDCLSIHSNFSDDFKKELQTKQEGGIEDFNNTNSNSCSDSEISDDENYNVDDIKKEIISKKSTRSSNLDLEIQPQVIELNFSEDIEELLTEKTRQITTDGATIRKYCKVRGLPYVTKSGRIVPKKTLGSACDCRRLGCTEKIPNKQRQFLLDYYYGLANVKKQSAFMVKFTERQPIILYDKKRDFTLKYYLPLTTDMNLSSPKTRVCQVMFVNTLACVTTRPTAAWDSFDKDPSLSGNLSPEESKQISEKCKFDREKCRDTAPEIKTNEIDFVYKAMPFEEYISSFSSTKPIIQETSEAIELPLGATSSIASYKRNRRDYCKMNKLHGKRYMRRDGKICAAKVMGPPCDCTAKNCSEKISEEQRKYIFKYFYSLGDIAKQRAFLVRFSERTLPKRVRVIKSRRAVSYTYLLPVTQDFDGEKAPVCSKMFTNTLVVSAKCVNAAWKRYAEGITFKDLRGRKNLGLNGVLYNESVVASVLSHVESLREEDPELKNFKMRSRGVEVFKFKTMFRLYEKWSGLSKYSKKAKTAHAYKTVLLHTFLPGGKYDYSHEPVFKSKRPKSVKKKLL